MQSEKFAKIIILIIGIIVPLFFLYLSLWTGNWKFFLISIGPCLVGSITGILALSKSKKEGNTTL